MELISKIENLASRHEASQLQRQVFVQNRIKTMNESIYYNVDFIHSAISENVQIGFRYFKWDVHGERVLRHDGAEYTVSPWALTWDDENYYLVTYDDAAGKIKHYRVDKMVRIRLLDTPRTGQDVFAKFDTAVYSKKIFGMYGGEEKLVKLRCARELAGVIIDRFGKDAMLVEDGDSFTVTVRVFESPTFLSWVMGFGKDMQVLSPDSTREALARQARDVLSLYETDGSEVEA
jgi:predicted DNA-binding transcriptional regulator YafY